MKINAAGLLGRIIVGEAPLVAVMAVIGEFVILMMVIVLVIGTCDGTLWL